MSLALDVEASVDDDELLVYNSRGQVALEVALGGAGVQQ